MCSASVDHQEDTLVLHENIELPEISLPAEIQQVLGHNPDQNPSSGFSLHTHLVAVWKNILLNGLKKDDLVSLINLYENPTNLVELIPPKLNLELAPLLRKQDQLTDNSHVEVQKQVGKGLCALGKGISLILEDSANAIPLEFKVKLLASLSDSAQILTNVFHRVSVTRKNLLGPLINKNVKDLLDKTPPSEFLFGSDLVEKIKTIKSVENLSRDLKLKNPSSYTAGIRRSIVGSSSNQKISTVYSSSNLNRQRPIRRVGETRSSRGQHSRNVRLQSYKNNFGSSHRDQRRKKDY